MSPIIYPSLPRDQQVDWSSQSTRPLGPSAQPVINEPEQCEPGLTVLSFTLLTPRVALSGGDHVLRYQMTLVDCPGVVPQAVAESLQFDIDALTLERDADSNLQYTISIPGSNQVINGWLAHEGGADLFGHVGGSYARYISSEPVQFAAAQRFAQVAVDITNYGTIRSKSGGEPDGPMTIDTYFRFGAASPVTVPVEFF